jgi:ATP-dependent HslUV protease ATP-binding subunit HslU
MSASLTPRQIVAELDTYVVGQTEAKKSVAIALRNRWRRRNAPPELRDEIMPANILMMGPTGVGKTEIARRLARLAGAPFIKVEATKFTEVGYVGRDVDSMIRDLVDQAVGLVRAEHEEAVQDRARELADERVLDLLVPPPAAPAPVFPFNPSPGETAPAPAPESGTRVKMRERLKAGGLDASEVEVEVTESASPMMQVFGPMGMEEMGMNIQDLFGGLGKKRKKRRVPVAEARMLLAQEEAQKLVDMDRITREALERVQESGIVFIDEIDKVAARTGQSGGPDVSREGVQRDLLPLVEGTAVTTKHGLVRTDHILFIASGAFHVAKPSDLIPEMQGRFPIRVELESLHEADFLAILTQPKNALLKQYAALLATEGVELTFTDEAVREIARVAAQVNAEVENIGARRLHTILTTLLEDVLFDVPDGTPRTHLEITGDIVRERLGTIAQNRDLSQYIL